MRLTRNTPGALLVLLAVGCGARAAPKQWVQLAVFVDSIWGRSELAVFLGEDDTATASMEWRNEDGPLLKGSATLSGNEIAALRRLAEQARPTSGQFWGTDRRGLDLPLVTLTIATNEKAAVLVCSGNPTFEEGPRKELLDLLWAIGERIRKAR
jgi:hypothetical protein